jgi:hypothetical protein
MDRTPWYPAHIKPVRVGWYEIGCDYTQDVVMMFWDGGLLWWTGRDGGVSCGPLVPGDKWRGLTKPTGRKDAT